MNRYFWPFVVKEGMPQRRPKGQKYDILTLMENGRREKFLKVYSNLPIAARKDIVLVLEAGGVKQPVTWEVAYGEILNELPNAGRMLDILEKLGII